MLIATGAFVSLFFFPFAGFRVEDRIFELSVLGVTENGLPTDNKAMFLLAGVILLIVFTFSIIFFFKKRMLQSRLTAIALLLNVALIAGMFFYSDALAEKMNTTIAFKTGTYLVLVPILFLVLANRSIRRDEMKVRAADRLR